MADINSIITMFEWNTWANERYRDVLGKMNLQETNIDTPYGNLLDRIIHIFASFKMWYQRMQGESPQSVISAKDFSSWEELFSTWKDYEKLLLDYVKELDAEDIEQEVTYTSFDGTVYTRKIKHILLHLTAHPNYHRGQISAIFKDRDLPRLPATDMVIYFLDEE